MGGVFVLKWEVEDVKEWNYSKVVFGHVNSISTLAFSGMKHVKIY